MAIRKAVVQKVARSLARKKKAPKVSRGRAPSKSFFNSLFNAKVGAPGKGQNWYDLARLQTDSGKRVRDYLASFDEEIDEE